MSGTKGVAGVPGRGRNGLSLKVNDRDYAFPQAPVVVICVDGSEPAYHERAISEGQMPHLESMLSRGTSLIGESVMPSFTNPNNVSIATGVPPAQHGVSGNYFFDRESGEEVMMNDSRFLRVPTIFAAFEQAGVDVAVVTAKDKLRRLLGEGLEKGLCVSAEKADDDKLAFVGRPRPSVYSADLSEFALAAGVRLLETRRLGERSLMYLSMTDYVQHKYAPDEPEALAFYAMLDGYLGRLDELGAVVVVTADHGMNAKSSADGQPQVVYLQTQLDAFVGADQTRVVLPITDPYTVHHGALGSFASVYLNDDGVAESITDELARTPGVEEVLPAAVAADRFELPTDRIGDIVVVATRNVALGTSPDRHDLAQLDRPLRSHGGLSEQQVPVLVNRRLALPADHRVRNFDAYWLALNFVRS